MSGHVIIFIVLRFIWYHGKLRILKLCTQQKNAYTHLKPVQLPKKKRIKNNSDMFKPK